MQTVRFDSVGGASGDMLLAALIDLGVDANVLSEQLSGLDVDSFSITAERVAAHGFSGTRVTVRTPESDRPAHRHLRDIRDIIARSKLPDRVKSTSTAVFTRLAEAEARVHGSSPEEVHFHEVGAMDAIVDIVGACLGLHLLDVDGVQCGPLPVGSGTTRGAHGVMPLPVPATAELLKGHLITQTGEHNELVTPTGAALLTTWQDIRQPSETSESTPVRIGHGFGHRELADRPNLLRAILLESNVASTAATDTCLVLECNLDDTVPELIGSLATKLLEEGALDVFTTPVQMKKQRPGTLLTLLCKPKNRDRLVDTVFAESTTFGIREYPVKRSILERRHETVQTPYGGVRVKIGIYKGNVITRAPEHGDCEGCAREHGVPVRTVYEAALRKVE